MPVYENCRACHLFEYGPNNHNPHLDSYMKVARIHEVKEGNELPFFCVVSDDVEIYFNTRELAVNWIEESGFTLDLNAPFNKYPL